MGLSFDLISEFVKITNDKKESPKEGMVYATVVSGKGGKYVKIDGSDLLTPADTTTDIEDGERVTLLIKDHKAVITGNVTNPSASTTKVDKVTESVNSVSDRVGTFELIVADKVDVKELEAYKATIENLIVGKADIEDLEATNAVIENLKVKDAEIENLVADKATIEDLEAVNATIENLKVKDAEIENAVIDNLEATKAEIKILNADFAQIKTLVSGNLTSDNILSFNITADKVTMEDAFIKDAMIDTVNASKINAGKINTNSVSIGSEDGGMLITGATQQFTDKNGNVRIQIGRDTSGDFTFALYGEDGQGQLINQNGITASAIADGLIVNDMVSDNAAISGGKLDISSVVTEINNDNTTTIKSNKIYLDEQNQSLEVAFKSLKTQVDTIKDIDSDLTTITDKIQSNTSKIEANKSSISTLLAEDAAIKKQVTDLEGNVVETTNTLTSKYTSLQQNLDGFKTTVNNTYATKTSVNDVKNNLSSNYSTTSAMNSAIEQKVDEISASVSSTYATKNEVKTIDDNIKANYSTTEQMESAISVAKNEINLGISQVYETKTEVSNKINNTVNSIMIGGTNLFKGYDANEIKLNDYQNTGSFTQFYNLTFNPADYIGKQFTISFYAKSPNGTTKLQLYNSNSSPRYFRFHTTLDTSLGVDWRYYTYTFTNTDSGSNFNPSNKIEIYAPDKMGVRVKKIKVELGNKATDWTPAPEDIDTSINNAITESKNYTDSQIKISKDAIELGVSQKYETKSNVTSQVSTALTNAKSYADTKKTEAINSANSTLNTTIANYYTKTQTDSQIKVAKDAIDLSVKNTYETKTEVTNKLNDIQVGGTNLAYDTNKGATGWGWGIQGNNGRTITSETINGVNCVKFVKDATSGSGWNYVSYGRFKRDKITPSTTYVVSFEMKSNLSFNVASVNLMNGDSSNTLLKTIAAVQNKVVANSTAWNKIIFKLTTLDTLPTSTAQVVYITGVPYSANATHYIRNLKLEVGNKATQWSPAPEDITADINTAKSDAITSANNTLNTTIANYYTKTQTDSQINVAKNTITQSVSSTYATKSDVTSSINGVNSSISNLQNRMSSAESKITDSSITNTVKKNFYTKTETENAITSKGYATQSQLQQTANDFQFKFTQSGGYNLVRNGNPKPNNYSHWWVSGNANWYLGNQYDIGIQTTSANEAYAGSAVFKVQKNCAYSFSCWLFAEQNTKGADVYFIGSSKDDGSYEQATLLYTGGKDGWTKVEATFTTGSNIEYGFIRIDNNGASNTSGYNVVFFSEVQVVKGSNCYPQWSPNPNEVYDGITTIDKSGVTVSASNINGYTCMTSWGFFVNKGGKDVVSVDDHGLRLFDAKIQLTHGNGNKYFMLDENGIVMYNPANGTHQWGKVAAINNKFTVASNGNSSGLSLGHHVNENYVEDILCDSNGVVTVQRQINHNGVFYNNYGQIFVRQSNQGGWEITGRSDSQAIKPGGANQGAIGSSTQYINQSWIANRYNPSSLKLKHLSHYIDDLECLKLVNDVKPARYFYKEYNENGDDVTTFTSRTSQLGLIYEDVRACSGRDLITNEEDAAINLYGMVSVLWGAVRNLNNRLNDVEYENVTLKNELEGVKNMLNKS